MFNRNYWINKAAEYEDARKYNDAIVCYEKMLENNPRDDYALSMMGSCYSETGRIEKALMYIDNAIAINPNDSYHYYNKGLVYYDNKDYETALDYFDKAILLEEDNATYWYFKGWCYFYLKNISNAIECFENSYNIDNDEKTMDLINDLKNTPNTKMQCPNCHSEIDDRYKFCIKCGFDLRNIPDQNSQDALREMIDYILGYAEMMDEHDYFMYDSPLVYDWKSNDLSVKLAVVGDLIDWLVFLGLADGYIAPEEVQFINSFLGFNFTRNDILNLIPKRLDENYFSNLPVSFKLLYDNDFLHRDYLAEKNIEGTSEFLFNIYGLMGELFIACDGNVDTDEKNALNDYMMNLRRNIDLFKNEYTFIRRGL